MALLKHGWRRHEVQGDSIAEVKSLCRFVRALYPLDGSSSSLRQESICLSFSSVRFRYACCQLLEKGDQLLVGALLRSVKRPRFLYVLRALSTMSTAGQQRCRPGCFPLHP